MGNSHTPAREDYVRFMYAKETCFSKDTGIENLKIRISRKINGKYEINVNAITDGINPEHTLIMWVCWIG